MARRIHRTRDMKIRNTLAMGMTKFFRFIADTFFAKRYGHRAVVLELSLIHISEPTRPDRISEAVGVV